MIAKLRRALIACLVLAPIASLSRAAQPSPGSQASGQQASGWQAYGQSAPSRPGAAKPAEWPSFMMPDEVLCLDELDFNAYVRTGRFNTRGSVESCTRLTQLTRVVVKQGQAAQKAQVMVVTGPLAWSVGWTNARLPLAGG